MSLLTPFMTEYHATVSFCPAHPWSDRGGGQFFSNDAVSALDALMSRDGLDSLGGSWVFRNIGSVRDSMRVDGAMVSSNYLRLWPASYDSTKCFPPELTCSYCANRACWKAAYSVGSLCYSMKQPVFEFRELRASGGVATDRFPGQCRSMLQGDFSTCAYAPLQCSVKTEVPVSWAVKTCNREDAATFTVIKQNNEVS